MIETVTLERGHKKQRATLENLAQFYIHDFTDFLGPERPIHVNEDGLYPDAMVLKRYWTEPDRSVWFIRADGHMAGFALLNKVTHSGEPADFNMAEFFVLRPFRGKDVAERAVIDILHRHPGRWEVAIMERNTPALRFWPRAVQRASIRNYESQSGVGENPSRTLLRFLAGS
ncbi:MAG TPA: GNAT family N-acetyltransferase [Hyphomonadaceae bacterium]|nr:GNAT family N-acetyltransferase [Hyphomonadaceae bacterium]